MPESRDNAGMFSTTGRQAAGTSLFDILVKDDKYAGPAGLIDFPRIYRDIKQILAAETRAAKTLKVDKSLQLRPVRDGKANITDQRVEMNNESRERLLRPELEFQNVFAYMQSSLIDKQNTIIADKKAVDILVQEKLNIEPGQEKYFVNLLDPSAKHFERFKMLPTEVQTYLKQYVGKDGVFLVREDNINKVFGFRSIDLSDWSYLQGDSHVRARWVAKLLHYAIRQSVGFYKDRIVVTMPAVVFGNMFSNVSQLTMKGIPLSYTIAKSREGIQQYNLYSADNIEFHRLGSYMKAHGLDDSSKEGLAKAKLEIRLKNNKLHRMQAAGIDSLIVEDLNEATTNGYVPRMRKLLTGDKFSSYNDSKYASNLGSAAKVLFMSKSTAPYKFSKRLVQQTDFLARYVMIEYNTEVLGQDFNTAMHEALTAFVFFDENGVPVLELFESLGGIMFSTFYLRVQRVARNLVQQNPTGVAAAGLTQYVTGAPVTGIGNTHILSGNLPNIAQLDEVPSGVVATVLDRLTSMF